MKSYSHNHRSWGPWADTHGDLKAKQTCDYPWRSDEKKFRCNGKEKAPLQGHAAAAAAEDKLWEKKRKDLQARYGDVRGGGEYGVLRKEVVRAGLVPSRLGEFPGQLARRVREKEIGEEKTITETCNSPPYWHWCAFSGTGPIRSRLAL